MVRQKGPEFSRGVRVSIRKDMYIYRQKSRLVKYSRWSVTRTAPSMSRGFFGGSVVSDRARCSGVRGSLCEPGTTKRQLSSYNALLVAMERHRVSGRVVYHEKFHKVFIISLRTYSIVPVEYTARNFSGQFSFDI